MTIDELLKMLPADQIAIINAALVQQRSDLQAMYAAAETDLTNIHAEVAGGKDDQIATLTADIAKAKTTIEGLAQQLASAATQRETDLKQKDDENAAAVAAIRAEVDARLAQLEDGYKVWITKDEAQPEILEKRKADIDAAITKENASRDAKVAELTAAKAKIAELTAAKAKIDEMANEALLEN